MYTLFYDLENKPFEMSPDPAFFWQGGQFQEGYDTLMHGILQGEGFLLLTGRAGSGKTILLEGVTSALGEDVAWTIVRDPKLERIDFYNAIAKGFGIEKPFTSKVQFLIQFSHFLHKADDENKKVWLLVDDCHLLSQEMLEELRLLANIEKDDKKLINIVFAARTSFDEMLLETQNRAVVQRVVGKVELEPLTVNETEAYITHRLQVAGTREKIFGAKAIQAVHLFSEGVPGRINGLCDYALTSGSMQKKKTIDNKVVELAVQRLGVSSSQQDARIFQDEHGQPVEADEAFLPPSIPITPPFTGFNLERDHRRILPRIFLGALFFIGLGSYFWMSNLSFLGSDEEEEVVVDEVPIVQAVVQASSSPAVTVLGKNNSEMNEKKAEALKVAILSKAYDNSEEQGEVETGLSDQQKLGGAAAQLSEETTLSPEEREPEGVADVVAEGTPNVQAEVRAETVPVSTPEAKVAVGSDASFGGPSKLEVNKIKEMAVDSQINVAGKDVRESMKILAREQPQSQKQLEIFEPLEPKKVILGLRPDSLQLTDAGRKALDKFIAKLKRYPRATIFVKGFVSAKTNSPENIQLSENRALTVQALMLAQGIDAEQIEVVGMGNQEPIATNDTREGRRKNRRVEILVINDGVEGM